jgi:hypothetical protein
MKRRVVTLEDVIVPGARPTTLRGVRIESSEADWVDTGLIWTKSNLDHALDVLKAARGSIVVS